jgi:protein-tyrosine phosphatase
MIDLHLHLLPGVDDGAKSLEDSLEMARALVSLGFNTLAPSPHHRAEYPSKSAELCEGKRAELTAALATAGVAVSLQRNAENFFLEDDFMAEVAAQKCRTMGSGKIVLVEAPYSGPMPMLLDVVFRMKLKGYTPLIAHPERCMEFEKKGRAAEVVAAGALLQLDVGALIGRYGKPAQTLARQFVAQGLYAVAATDLHAPVKAAQWVGESLEALRRLAGDDGLKQLFDVNPAQLLVGQGV